MAAQTTPSKQVSCACAVRSSGVVHAVNNLRRHSTATNTSLQQAASAIESFKMESPVKKLDFTVANKENLPSEASLESTSTDIESHKPVVEETKKETKETLAVAPGIKAVEADEPLLQENPQRFVLFPIKYHEVSPVTRLDA